MDEKKRAKLMRICRAVALIMAVLMVAGVVMQGFF